jgi:hypothetical protein
MSSSAVRWALFAAAAAVLSDDAQLRAHVQRSQPGSARALLTRARQAIGGEARLRRLKALVLYGTARVGFNGVTGELLPPHPVEVRILLPDNYLRIDQDEDVVRRAGFSGAFLLNQWTPRRPDVRVSTRFGPEAMQLERLECARLVVGLLAETETGLSLQVRGTASRAGDATVHLVGPHAFSAFLDFEATGAPWQLRYAASVTFPRPLTPEEKKLGVPPPRPPEKAEVTLAFEDRRVVGGLALPHRVRRSAREILLEELRFERIAVNPPLTLADFRRP